MILQLFTSFPGKWCEIHSECKKMNNSAMHCKVCRAFLRSFAVSTCYGYTRIMEAYALCAEREVVMADGWMIPKNIRQIGENHGRIHIYIEDYVATFLTQFSKNLGACMCVGACYGKIYEETDCINIVIDGAVMDTARPETVEQVLSEEPYRRAEREGITYFAGKKVIGKIIADTEMQHVQDDQAAQVLRTTGFMGSRMELALMVGKEEGIRAFFVSIRGTVEKIENYYIYYDKNEPMQNYLIRWNENVRGISEERKAQIREQEEMQQIISVKKKEAFPLLECAACLLLVIACAIGVVSINNYQRMQQVEENMINLARDFYERDEALPVSGENIISEEGAVPEEWAMPGENVPQEELPIYVPQSERENGQGQSATLPGEVENGVTVIPGETQEQSTIAPEITPVQGQTTPAPTPIVESVEAPVVSYREYIVQQGDTLSSICYVFYQDRSKVDEVCRLNGISNPDTLAIGQKILLP